MATRDFDSLTKQLARRPSRRRVMQVLAGAIATGSLGALGRADDALARPRVPGICQVLS
jgi:hypothetical protein